VARPSREAPTPGARRAERIMERVRAIPGGVVRSYGDIDPSPPRLVGHVLATTHEDLPRHRVVRESGGRGPALRGRQKGDVRPDRTGYRPDGSSCAASRTCFTNNSGGRRVLPAGLTRTSRLQHRNGGSVSLRPLGMFLISKRRIDLRPGRSGDVTGGHHTPWPLGGGSAGRQRCFRWPPTTRHRCELVTGPQ
jgi:alkylated DNA nucleotide flippase Atl1